MVLKSMIQVSNLSKTFKVHKKQAGLVNSIKSLFWREWIKKDALKNATFNIMPGELVGLVGANGAGKTTLVKILSGIIHPSTGTVNVLGFKPWERKNDFRKQISLIMGQKAQLWWDLPAEDCFILLKEIYEIPDEQYEKSLNELVEALDVRHVLNIQIRRLSLGERMKMELIAALLHQPKVVFLDEPTIGLDITAQKAVRDFLATYRKKHNPAMILTSHYMEDIKKLCERIIIMKNGEFVYDGSLQKVLDSYSEFKVLNVQLNPDSLKDNSSNLEMENSKLISNDKSQAKFKVKKDDVGSALTEIVKKFDVIDVKIEEEEIETIIESLMKR
jgi:ABC-2 type transport system ATP-binding protein